MSTYCRILKCKTLAELDSVRLMSDVRLRARSKARAARGETPRGNSPKYQNRITRADERMRLLLGDREAGAR